MSRVRQLKKNLKVNLIFYILYTFVGFFSRKIFLDYLGDEFVGLVGTLQSILGFLNLAELGIGTAIGFSLYKPIYDNDREALNKIISLLGYLYKRVALITLGLGVLCSIFFGYFFSDTPFSLALILYCFYGFLISSILGYIVHFHQSLLQADQKGYIITSYLQTTNITRQILQAVIAYYFQSLYLWISLELLFSIMYSIVIRQRIKREYPWLQINRKTDNNVLQEFSIIITKVKQVFVHKMASFMTYGTDQILIYAFVNIQSVAFFGNYNLIYKIIENLVNKSFAGIHAGVGNLIAEDDAEKIEKVFWEMITLRFIIAGVMALNLYHLIDSFILIWLGDKYILDDQVVLFMTINFFVVIVRLPIDSFLNGYGLYKDTWAPILELLLNLILSIILGSLWGIAGIILATTISVTSILVFWKPYYLFKSGFNKNVLSQFWPHILKLILCILIPAWIIDSALEYLTLTSPINYLQWVVYALKLNLLILLLVIPFMYYFGRGFKDLLRRFKKRNK